MKQTIREKLIKEFPEVKLLDTESVDGITEFISSELALRDQELIEKIEKMKIPVDIHKNGGILTRKEITCNSVLTDVSKVVRNHENNLPNL